MARSSSSSKPPHSAPVALILALLAATGATWSFADAPGTPGEPLPATSPSPAPAAAAAPAGTQTAADPVADSLVGRWIEALGGMETFERFRTARFTLTTELYDPATGRLQRARPRYVTLAKMNGEQLSRIERWNWDGSHFIVQAFDGDTAWANVDGEPAPPGQMDADEALYVSRDVFYWFSLPYKLRDPGVNLHYDGRDREDRHVVRVTFGQGVGEDVWWHLFRDGRSWPVETRYQTNGSGSVQRLRFEDIRSADDYFYPAQRVHVTGDGDRVWKILRMTDVELNPDVRPEAFTDPGASPWLADD